MKDQLGFGSVGLAAGLIAFFSPIALLFYVKRDEVVVIRKLKWSK